MDFSEKTKIPENMLNTWRNPSNVDFILWTV